MSDDRQKIVDALEEHNLSQRLRQKTHQEIAAREAIIGSISKWTGHAPDEDGRLPLVRGGVFMGYEPSLNLNALAFPLGDRISSVTFGVWIEDAATLRVRHEKFSRLRDALFATYGAIKSLDLLEQAHIPDGEFPADLGLEVKFMYSMGYLRAVKTASLHALISVSNAVESLERQLQVRPRKAGRPRKEAKYRVAEGFALLFHYVTDEIPTFSKGADGYSGKFTPELDALFRAVGWTGDLSGPAKAACNAVKKMVEAQPETPSLGQISGLLSGLQ